MRDGHGRHIGPQLDLPLEQQVVVAHRIVLDIAVGMRRQRRAVGVDRVGIDGAGAVLACRSRNVAVGNARPSASAEIERVHIGAEVVVMTPAEMNHRSTVSEAGGEHRAIPRLGDRGETHLAAPGRVWTPSERSPQPFFRASSRVQLRILRRIVVFEVACAGRRCRQTEIGMIAGYAIPTALRHALYPRGRAGC